MQWSPAVQPGPQGGPARTSGVWGPSLDENQPENSPRQPFQDCTLSKIFVTQDRAETTVPEPFPSHTGRTRDGPPPKVPLHSEIIWGAWGRQAPNPTGVWGARAHQGHDTNPVSWGARPCIPFKNCFSSTSQSHYSSKGPPSVAFYI